MIMSGYMGIEAATPKQAVLEPYRSESCEGRVSIIMMKGRKEEDSPNQRLGRLGRQERRAR